jgi:hypothetical protein
MTLLAAIRLLLSAGMLLAPVLAQTTQGLIRGHIYDSSSGRVIEGAGVGYKNLSNGDTASADTNRTGMFAFNNVSPGIYSLHVTAAGYQSLDTSDIELFVAGRVELDIPLRPAADVYDQKNYFNGVISPPRRSSRDSAGRVIRFYAADLETTKSAYLPVLGGDSGLSQAAVSYVIDSRLINDLPLLGRDVYAALSLVAGVTSDAPTSRSLGLSANGQRPSSSNFLLDGLENNNSLLTGPMTTIAPEMVEEYRVSTNSFSAEYGRTSGYLANVVTRSGQNDWHGLVWINAKNEALNANDFQRNVDGRSRVPLKEWEPGLSAAGPVLRDRWFVSGAFDYLRFRSTLDTQTFVLPTSSFRPDPGSLAEQLLRTYPAPSIPGAGQSARVSLSPPTSLDRYLFLPRTDYLMKQGRQRLMARLALSKTSRPDLVWSPYNGFTTPLNSNDTNLAAAWTGLLRGGIVGEVRTGWSSDDLRFDRPHPEVPSLISLSDGATLPGSRTFYSFRNRSRTAEIVANASRLIERHLVKFGIGLLDRHIDGYLTPGRDGQFYFRNLQAWGQDRSSEGLMSESRLDWPGRLSPLNHDRNWTYKQFFAYLQDSYKLMPRLVLNYGLRYEYYGSPRTTGGGQDAIFQLGSGVSLAQRLSGARLVPLTPGQPLYSTTPNQWSVRVGFSYAFGSSAKTVLRGAYGIYYDRAFDNLWQNIRNNNNLFTSFPPPVGFDYLHAAGSLQSFSRDMLINPPLCDPAFDICEDRADAQLTLYDPGIGNAKVHNYFLGVQHQMASSLSVELTALGSNGRRLVTTDLVNRFGSTQSSQSNPDGRFNPAFSDIRYRAAQGESDYYGMTSVLRYRTSRAYRQASYTWSHTIDNQSDPLTGDFYDLLFTAGGARANEQRATFTSQFSPGLDRANSDFDQRHNFGVLSTWALPAPATHRRLGLVLKNWNIAQLTAVRSGLPFTVFTPATLVDGVPQLFRNRAQLVNPGILYAFNSDAAGGKRLFNPAAFAPPIEGQMGNTGRNAFRGPGLFNLDLSLGRSFGLPWFREAGRLTLRADFFNVLNHANLNNPVSTLQTQGVGIGTFGRLGRDTGFPAQTPFRETARQIQLRLKVDF